MNSTASTCTQSSNGVYTKFRQLSNKYERTFLRCINIQIQTTAISEQMTFNVKVITNYISYLAADLEEIRYVLQFIIFYHTEISQQIKLIFDYRNQTIQKLYLLVF